MTSENIDNSPRESVVRWGTTKFGDGHTTYDEIEKDPYLRERIEPKDGFKKDIDGYKYTVKFYDAGKISVFKKKNQVGYNFDTETQIRAKDKVTEIDEMIAQILKTVKNIEQKLGSNECSFSGS
jgi:hypothetical protein